MLNINARLVLAGDLGDVEREANLAGVALQAFRDSDSLLSGLAKMKSVQLIVMQFFIPFSSSIELVPDLRRIRPEAKVWIATSHQLEDVDPKWLTGNLCDPFIQWPPSWNEIQAE